MDFRVCHSVPGDGALHEFGTVGNVVGCCHLWIGYPTVTVTVDFLLCVVYGEPPAPVAVAVAVAAVQLEVGSVPEQQHTGLAPAIKLNLLRPLRL